MNVFNYNTLTKQLEINEPEILLVKEFKALIQRDKSAEKDRATRELSYIYLAIDWKSPYSQYSEHERHDEAISDSGLTESEFNDPIFREACRKYRALQDSNKSIKLLEAAKRAADQFIDYFETIVDLNERDNNGKPVFQAEKVMKEMATLHKVHEELITLEDQVKKELTEQSTVRAGAVDGFDPGDFKLCQEKRYYLKKYRILQIR